MNKATSKALESSIKHWERMRDGKRKKSKDIESSDGMEIPMADDCELCAMFDCHVCEGCPVMENTGYDNCESTPYWNARAAWKECGIDSDEFKAAAQKMIDFLISLREPS